MRKFLLLALVAVFGLFNTVQAQSIVNNGDFESWEASGVPSSWTTIDSGITVSENTTEVHSGAKSASIEVTTKTQKNTDFRQNVNVEAGVTYDVSLWIYHTDNTASVRFYIDDYLNYSDYNLVGVWQELTREYTATATGTIEIGCRFYDKPGFVSSSIIYLDDFTMQPQGTIVAVTGVALNKTSTTLTEGANETLVATVLPSDATDKTVTWSSDNTAVATVSATGVVTAVAAGTANITVTTTDGSHTASCAVTVTTVAPPSPAVPLSNWAILLSVVGVVGFVAMRFVLKK